mmetsp:Transcript_14934/g.30956  ORF Transcript_14934/g.30956 Transcript_14934/m.30956 type:complete len:205 (-) Transcript_14934:132-746(-)
MPRDSGICGSVLFQKRPEPPVLWNHLCLGQHHGLARRLFGKTLGCFDCLRSLFGSGRRQAHGEHLVDSSCWPIRGSRCHSHSDHFGARDCRFGAPGMDGPARRTRYRQGWLPGQGQDGIDHDGPDNFALHSFVGGCLLYSVQDWHAALVPVFGNHNYQWQRLFHCCGTSSIGQEIERRKVMIHTHRGDHGSSKSEFRIGRNTVL